MTHYRTRVTTVSSTRHQQRINLTLPADIDSPNCDIHFVDTEKFRKSPFFRLLMSVRELESPSWSEDRLRHQTMAKLVERNRSLPIPMPYTKVISKASGSFELTTFLGDMVWLILHCEARSFPFCVDRGDADPDEISSALGAFRPPEPAVEWESFSDSPVMHTGDFTHPTSDAHMLSPLAQHYKTAIERHPALAGELEKIQFSLRGRPADYDSAYGEAKKIEEQGEDPSLRPDLDWNRRPDIIAYRKLLTEEAKLTALLHSQQTIENCRIALDLLYGAGALGAHIPEPDDIAKHLEALTPLRPRAEAEIGAPQGEPLELLRRFALLDRIISERQEEVWRGAINEEPLILLELAQMPLARAIAGGDAAPLAKSVLPEQPYRRLEEIVSRPPRLIASAAEAYSGLLSTNFAHPPGP